MKIVRFASAPNGGSQFVEIDFAIANASTAKGASLAGRPFSRAAPSRAAAMAGSEPESLFQLRAVLLQPCVASLLPAPGEVPRFPMRRGGPPITKSLGMAPIAPTRIPTPPPAPAVSNAPSAFYRQHHTIEVPAIDEHEFRPAWRIKTKLMLLLECKRIDRRQLEAAAAFKGWCEAVGRQRTSAWLAVRVDGGRRPEGLILTYQIDAARRLHNASLALGRDRIKLLHWALVDDLPWTEIGKRLGLSKKTATYRTVEAIVALALWRAGESLPPAPASRFRIEPGRW